MWSFIFGMGFNCSCSFLSVFLRRSCFFLREPRRQCKTHGLMNIRRNNYLWSLLAHMMQQVDFLLFLIAGTGADTVRLVDLPKKSHGNSVINSPSGSGGYNRCSFNLHNMKVCFWLGKQWCKQKKRTMAFFPFYLPKVFVHLLKMNSRFKMICNVFILIWNTQHTHTLSKGSKNEGKTKKDHIPAEVT